MGKKYTQLKLEERDLIQTQLSMGIKPVEIARSLDRSASTVSRELKRNGWKPIEYKHHTAAHSFGLEVVK